MKSYKFSLQCTQYTPSYCRNVLVTQIYTQRRHLISSNSLRDKVVNGIRPMLQHAKQYPSCRIRQSVRQQTSGRKNYHMITRTQQRSPDFETVARRLAGIFWRALWMQKGKGHKLQQSAAHKYPTTPSTSAAWLVNSL